MGKHIDHAAKQQALADIKNGLNMSEASEKHGGTETKLSKVCGTGQTAKKLIVITLSFSEKLQTAF